MDPSSLLTLGVLIAVFYFLLIRPQQKRLKQHQALISSLALGDEVVTIGGIFGTVRRLGDSEIHLEVADGTVIRVSRQAISKRVGDDAEEPEEPQAELEEPAAIPETTAPEDAAGTSPGPGSQVSVPASSTQDGQDDAATEVQEAAAPGPGTSGGEPALQGPHGSDPVSSTAGASDAESAPAGAIGAPLPALDSGDSDPVPASPAGQGDATASPASKPVAAPTFPAPAPAPPAPAPAPPAPAPAPPAPEDRQSSPAARPPAGGGTHAPSDTEEDQAQPPQAKADKKK